MAIQVACAACSSMFKAPDSAAGKKAKCPSCGGVIEIPLAVMASVPVDDIIEAEEVPATLEPGQAGAAATTLPNGLATGRRPCPMCGEMIASEAAKCRFCGEVFDPVLRAYGKSTGQLHGGDDGQTPLFLHIPVARLVVMSILTFHIYEAYWIYKNWRYLKQRDGLAIWPFWRGVFGIFFCHSLLDRMHKDDEARKFVVPTFAAGGLATGWVLLVIVDRVLSRTPGVGPLLISAVLPSFLCLVPVQKYVNSVAERRNLNEPYYKWSWGHLLCIAFGLLSWFGVVVLLLVGDAEM